MVPTTTEYRLLTPIGSDLPIGVVDTGAGIGHSGRVFDPPTSTAPPGWYDDPVGGAGKRWWDGARWTEQVVWRPVLAQV